jgi:hypothetical protein
MASMPFELPTHHRLLLDRFITACQADGCVIAALLGGSYARRAADSFSDLDLYVITTDDTYEDFLAGRFAFTRRLGEALFLEDFDLPDTVFFIFSDGAEGELGIGCQSRFDHLHAGPFIPLVDKRGILQGAVFQGQPPDPAKQASELRQAVFVFWHELSHFITALGRGQLWWAYGQLEALRAICLVLARLRHDFTASPDAGEPYFKIEKSMSAGQLAPLLSTYCPREPGAMLEAVRAILHFYRELARPLAQKHGLQYPASLDQVMSDRLDNLRNAL